MFACPVFFGNYEWKTWGNALFTKNAYPLHKGSTDGENRGKIGKHILSSSQYNSSYAANVFLSSDSIKCARHKWKVTSDRHPGRQEKLCEVELFALWFRPFAKAGAIPTSALFVHGHYHKWHQPNTAGKSLLSNSEEISDVSPTKSSILPFYVKTKARFKKQQ